MDYESIGNSYLVYPRTGEMFANTSSLNIISGKCGDCGAFDDIIPTERNENVGYFGYLVTVNNCNGNKCDVYLNNQGKRKVCKGVESITECLECPYSPGKCEWTTCVCEPDGGSSNTCTWDCTDNSTGEGNQIELQEVIEPLQRFATACNTNGDFYRGIDDIGCLPYSSTIHTNDLSTTTCYNGENTIFNIPGSCCENDPTCSINGNGECKPCMSYFDNVPDSWKTDVCKYFCPDYATQREVLQGGGFFTSNEQLCSAAYKAACDIAGCTPAQECQVAWGGCNATCAGDLECIYRSIDWTFCKGGSFSVINEINGNNFVSKKSVDGICNTNTESEAELDLCNGKNELIYGSGGFDFCEESDPPPNAKNVCNLDPWPTPKILPIVVAYKPTTVAPTAAPTIPAPENYYHTVEYDGTDCNITTQECISKGAIPTFTTDSFKSNFLCTYGVGVENSCRKVVLSSVSFIDSVSISLSEFPKIPLGAQIKAITMDFNFSNIVGKDKLEISFNGTKMTDFQVNPTLLTTSKSFTPTEVFKDNDTYKNIITISYISDNDSSYEDFVEFDKITITLTT